MSNPTQKTTFLKYYQSVNFLESLGNLPNGIIKKNPFAQVIRFKLFLKLIGSPQNYLKFIHITGTAGKGTTVNLIHNILRQAGFRVGSYFSPHTTTTIERIKVNNLYIDPDEFVKLTEYLKPYLSKFINLSPYGGLNYHDCLLAIALLYFKKQKVDYVVLEAGVGGLTDITNVIPSPAISIITNINKDHGEILGNSLGAIAKNKAGIIKKGSYFITAEKSKKFINYFKKICWKQQAKFVPLNGADLIKKFQLEKFSVKDNLNLAITAGKTLKISNQNIIQGIKMPPLPCRFEIIQKKPIVILDGSHNIAKINILQSKLTKLTYSSFNLVFGCAADKNAYEMLKKLLPDAQKLFLTRFIMPYRKVYDLKKLHLFSKKIKPGLEIQTFIDPWQALKTALKNTKNNEVLLITGSFFLTGELRKKWISEKKILALRASVPPQAGRSP